MEYLTKNEVIKETGITIGKFRHYIDYNYFKDYKKLSNGYWLISREDVDRLKSDIQFMNESYTLNDLKEMLGYSTSGIIPILDSKFANSYKLIFNKYYIKKDTIDGFLQNHPEIKLILSGEYISLSKVADMAKKPIYVIDNLIVNHKDYLYVRHPINNEIYIFKDSAEEIVALFNYVDNSYTLKDLCKILDCEYEYIQKFTKYLSSLFPNKLILKQRYFEKQSVDVFLTNLKPQERTLQHIIVNYFHKAVRVKGKGTISPIKPKNESIIVDDKTYLSIEKTAEEFNLSQNIIKRSIKRKKFNDIVLFKGQNWIYDGEVIKVKSIYNESIDFIKLPENVLSNNQKRQIKNDKLVSKYFPNAFKFDIFGLKTWRIPISDIDNFKRNHLKKIQKKMQIREEQDPKALYDLLMEEYQATAFRETLQTYNEFFINRLHTTRIKAIRNYTLGLVKSIIKLLKNIKKEIYLYTDKELEILFLNNNFSTADKQNLSMFLKFCRNKFKNSCMFVNDYNRYVAQTKDNVDSGIYSEQIWMQYFTYLTDIDRHIRKAFMSTNYSKIWLYTLLHLSIAWRREDILSIPALDIEGIDIYTLEWFENNTFTITNGQIIINAIKDILSTSKANKNDVRSHFIVYPILVLSTSIAFIIAEFHRKANKETTLFGKSKFFKEHFRKFFDDKNLSDFSNTKANRSLLTHNFNNAVTTEGMCDLAYSLSTYLRSHKLDKKSGLAVTTAQYIYSTNSDGDANNVAYNLFKRGHFGWLYYTLLNISGMTNGYKIDDVTNAIVNLKNEFKPLAIESLSSYLEYEYKERRNVVKELLGLPKEKIRQILLALSRGEMPSKIDYTQCLKSGNCSNKLTTKCLGCKYKIPTNYTLSVARVELDSIIHDLNNTSDDNFTLRQKYTFQVVSLLVFFKEAREAFDQWDPNYIRSFINIDDLKTEIEKLEKTKFMPF